MIRVFDSILHGNGIFLKRNISIWPFFLVSLLYFWGKAKLIFILSINKFFYYLTFGKFKLEIFIGKSFYEIKYYVLLLLSLFFIWSVREKVINTIKQDKYSDEIKFLCASVFYFVLIMVLSIYGYHWVVLFRFFDWGGMILIFYAGCEVKFIQN